MKYILGALAATTVKASFDSLSSCEAFASQFSNTCGGVEEADAFADYTQASDWTLGDDITCGIVDDGDAWDPDYFLNPNGGSQSTSATVTRKVCVTCRQSSSQVYIRFQSNGMPSHCYGSDLTLGTYPVDQVIDWEVKWNQREVAGTWTYAATAFDQQDELDALLCSYGGLQTVPSVKGYTQNGDTGTTHHAQNHVAGYAFDNIAIFHAVTSNG